MIMTVTELKQYVTTDISNKVLEARLQALELLVRGYTNNNFQKRAFRSVAVAVADGNQLLSAGTTPFKAGDTLEITESDLNSGLVTVSAVSDGVITVTEELFDESGVVITKVVYPADVKQGVARMLQWQLDNGDKVGVQSETISRHSVTYFNIESYADIVSAIHDVQTEMGITGTTAQEAATTIQGSLSSTKAAWDNWLTGTGSIDALVETVVNSAGLLADAIGKILPNLTSGISQLISQLAPEIPPLINQLLPSIISSIVTLISSFGSQLPAILATILPVITQTAPQVINTLITALISSLPIIVSSALQLILALATGITQSLPELIPAIVEVVLQIVTTLIENIELLVDAAIALISALAEGLIAALPILIEQAPTIIAKLVQELVAVAPQLLLAAAEIITTLISGIADNLFELGKSAGEIITTIVDGIGEMWDSIINVGSQVVDKIKEGISNAWEGLKSWFNGLWDGLFGNRNVNVNVNGSSNVKPAASGLNYVPRNNFPALLHEGEAVLTASEAKAWRKGNGGAGNGVTINQYINAPAQTPVQLASATAAYFEQARWAI